MCRTETEREKAAGSFHFKEPRQNSISVPVDRDLEAKAAALNTRAGERETTALAGGDTRSSPPPLQHSGALWDVQVVPGRQGSTQGCAAVGEDVAVAVGVVVVLPSLGRPGAFDLQRGAEHRVAFRVKASEIFLFNIKKNKIKYVTKS